MPVIQQYPLATVTPEGMPNTFATPDVRDVGVNQVRDLQQAGENLSKASETVAGIALYEAGLQDEADAKSASTAMNGELRAALLDPENGYFAARGKDAIDRAKPTMDKLDSIRRKYLDTLKTRDAQRMFDRQATADIAQAQDQVARKVIVERRNYADTASAARVESKISSATANFDDLDAVNRDLKTVEAEIRSQSEQNRDPPEVMEQKVQAAKSKTVANVVRRWVEVDPYKAKDIRDANSKLLTADDALVLDHVLREGVLRRGSIDNANTIRNGGNPNGSFDNNVGNITKSGFKYAGEKGAPQGAFETFRTPEGGVAAAYQTITAKAKQNGGSISFNDLIGGNLKVRGWAARDDGKDPMLKGNNPEVYAMRLARSVGLRPGDDLPIDDDGKMATVLKEMNRHEKGRQSVADDAFSAGITLAKGGRPADGQSQADADMTLTPQEKNLWTRHRANLDQGGVKNADGTTSTLSTITTEIDGRTYVLPTIWDNKRLGTEEAIGRAKKAGLEKFPSYGSEEEANARYDKLHSLIEKDTARTLADRPELDPRTGKPTLAWQLAQAEKIANPELREATRSRLKSMHADDDAVRAEQRRAIGQEVLSMVMGNKLTDAAQVPIEKWSALEPDQQRSMTALMEANAKNKDNPPNPSLYAELMRQAVEDPEAFKKRDLVPLATQLPNAHWTKFQDLQASMGRRDNAEEAKQVSMARAMRVSDAMLRSAGIYLGYADSKGKITKAKEFDDFKAQFQSALDQEIDRYRAANKKLPDDGELTKIADRLLLQGRFRDTGFIRDDRTVSFLQGKGEGAPQFYVRYSDIPPDRRKTMEDKLKAAGKPYNKQSVENAYTAWRLAGGR